MIDQDDNGCAVDARLLESSETYKAASQRASLEVEKLRTENEDLKQQLDAGFAVYIVLIEHLFYNTPQYLSLHCFDTVARLARCAPGLYL